jgi:hypothetical protein
MQLPVTENFLAEHWLAGQLLMADPRGKALPYIRMLYQKTWVRAFGVPSDPHFKVVGSVAPAILGRRDYWRSRLG